jgi:hypothetical protein
MAKKDSQGRTARQRKIVLARNRLGMAQQDMTRLDVARLDSTGLDKARQTWLGGI